MGIYRPKSFWYAELARMLTDTNLRGRVITGSFIGMSTDQTRDRAESLGCAATMTPEQFPALKLIQRRSDQRSNDIGTAPPVSAVPRWPLHGP
jgi:hypothetical protein